MSVNTGFFGVTAEALDKAAPSRQYRDIAEGLLTMMAIQRRGEGLLAPELRGSDAASFREAALGAFVELGELVNECQWKSWRVYKDPTPDELVKMLDEGADLLTFVARMFNILELRYGVKATDWADAFIRTGYRNESRFRGEVEGREPPTKICLSCKQTFSEGAEMSVEPAIPYPGWNGDGLQPVVCMDCGH